MFVMLRRFTIPMTMLAEFQVAGIRPPPNVVISVAVLCFGAMIAVKDFDTELWVVRPPALCPLPSARHTVSHLATRRGVFKHTWSLVRQPSSECV
jgi:hypothetical protein